MPAYKNKGFFIGLAIFSILLIMAFFNFIPESLNSIDGKSFIIKVKGEETEFFVNSKNLPFRSKFHKLIVRNLF